MPSIASLLAELPARWLGFGVLGLLAQAVVLPSLYGWRRGAHDQAGRRRTWRPEHPGDGPGEEGAPGDCGSATGGPASWRIARAELEAFRARERAEQVAREERGRAKRLRELAAAWATCLTLTGRRLRGEIPKAIYRPLAKLVDPQAEDHAAARADLAAAYGSRTEAGVEDLALAIASSTVLGHGPSSRRPVRPA